MVEKHASQLQTELRFLNNQLAEIPSLHGPQADTEGEAMPVANPMQFAEAVNHLLHRVQNVNRSVGKAFTARPLGSEEQPADASLAATEKAIPLREAEEIGIFVGKMAVSARASVKH